MEHGNGGLPILAKVKVEVPDTAGSTHPTSSSTDYQVKAEPDSTTDQAGQCSQSHHADPFKVRIRPFTIIHTPDSDNHQNCTDQTGFEIVFKTEQFLDSEDEGKPELQSKEQSTSDMKAGGSRDQKEHLTSNLKAGFPTEQEEHLTSNLKAGFSTEQEEHLTDMKAGFSTDQEQLTSDMKAGFSTDQEKQLTSDMKAGFATDQEEHLTSDMKAGFATDQKQLISDMKAGFATDQEQLTSETKAVSSRDQVPMFKTEPDSDSYSDDMGQLSFQNLEKRSVDDIDNVNNGKMVFVNRSIVSLETVSINAAIKKEPADNVFCVGMGLLSSIHLSETESVKGGVISREIGAVANCEEGLVSRERKTEAIQAEKMKCSVKHMNGKTLQCSHCPSTFPCLSHLRRHLLSHGEDRPFVCSVCQASFKLLCHLKQHSFKHTGDRPYTCQECSASFTRSDHLKQHVQSHRGVRPYLCTVCNTAFTQAAHLRKHMIRHRDNRVVVCKIKACKAVFTSVRALEEHRKKHEDDRKCKECNLVLSRADDIKRHMLIHTKDKPFECPHCPARFRQAGHLSTHSLQHTGSKPFACELCGCAFKQSHHLKRHMEVHQGQRPFSCHVCSASFRRGSSLTRHGQKCHRPSTSISVT